LLFSTAQAEIYTTSDGHQFEVNLRPDKPEITVMQGLGRKGTAESIKIVKEMLQEERNKELYEFVKFYLEKEL
jgi:hypothetical protein